MQGSRVASVGFVASCFAHCPATTMSTWRLRGPRTPAPSAAHRCHGPWLQCCLAVVHGRVRYLAALAAARQLSVAC
jgi:hypothetical protein